MKRRLSDVAMWIVGSAMLAMIVWIIVLSLAVVSAAGIWAVRSFL